ncbi:hypothetical protein R5W24_003530 [Gemmata sp. JC717]|uniref:Uncharacterized protein n=1 Tax=Gemmata algarum TaxID=2975278 RepID=A0ABU5ETH0_9BACT|nr:hypothetical protein [Gemmata algarum]MDY3554408.1 hypothetical protein [Gemmata algarum]MDY3558549.1 hypothetical protein [Gemmata algarum]
MAARVKVLSVTGGLRVGYGTIWRLGHEYEARLLWEDRFPARRLAIDVKFITGLELQILRCRLHGLAAFDPKVEVYESAFPKTSDPEWEAWYQNIEAEYNRAIDIVHADFLSELRAIEPAQLASLGSAWGAACEGWWHQEWPEHAAWALGEFVRVAQTAGKRRMCVFATHFG